MKTAWQFIFAIGVATGTATASYGGAQVSCASYGDDWPFPFDSAEVTCDPPGSSVVMKADGKTYALNGKARGQAAARGYLDHQDLMKRDKYGAFTKGVTTVSDLIALGLKQCH